VENKKQQHESKVKEIKVDKLIVKANEVIIIDENKRRRQYDPWGFPVRKSRGDFEVEDDRYEFDKEEEGKKMVDNEHNERRKPPFSWI